MDTGNALLIIEGLVVWTLLGFMAFLVIYGATHPWRDRMGRHVSLFMAAFGVVFAYAFLQQYIGMPGRLYGWIAVLVPAGLTTWWRVAMLVSYQLKARRAAQKEETHD